MLSGTNYDPNVGAYVTITNNDSTPNSTMVVASNFLGSTQAFFKPGTVPYSENYEGDLAVTQTDQVLILSFTLWIPATKTSGHYGGFLVNLLTFGR